MAVSGEAAVGRVCPALPAMAGVPPAHDALTTSLVDNQCSACMHASCTHPLGVCCPAIKAEAAENQGGLGDSLQKRNVKTSRVEPFPVRAKEGLGAMLHCETSSQPCQGGVPNPVPATPKSTTTLRSAA